MEHFEQTKERLIRYAKINTRSDEASQTIPSTKRQFDLLNVLVSELEDIGMEEVHLNLENAFVTATLPANVEGNVPTIGFISHVDTADFNSENVNPQVHEDYAGEAIPLDEAGKYQLTVEEFPQLANYMGQTLITTDGSTLLGADDKAGIAEIITAMEYFLQHPEIPHGKIRIAFGPDEEIGRGADHFDVEAFQADFAYTVDGGPVGELEYESFNAAQATVQFQGKNIHPGTAKDQMVNAILLMHEFIAALPAYAVPEHTEGRQGFYLVMDVSGNVDEADLTLIIRHHEREIFEEMKAYLIHVVERMNQGLDMKRVNLRMEDQYYNMGEIIAQDMYPVEVAERAMKAVGVEPIVKPIRGGTDGSKISFMGIPTPNIFAGGENMHGRYEFVAVESMVKATETIIKIAELVAKEAK
ncbi:peptidase T [Suicoccus acidiformans]|uniref:Peptidase T n=1 Tax=Suicoccus acidiformans TaxID=2036206 RepID=A0A347WNT3_9LACT|nr:peptidase T [Suicoccus acidiformans]AXY26740.1 peptidase T [Suicoccus acidiformans]